MVLPLLAGMAGSALAAGGTLGAISPLLASALGTGIGSFIETGDPKSALLSGATAGLGGAVLGPMVNSGLAGLTPGAGAAAGAAGAPAAGAAGAPSVMAPAMKPPTMAAPLPAAPAASPGLLGGLGGFDTSRLMGPEAIEGYTGALTAMAAFPDPMKSGGGDRGDRNRERRGPQMSPRRSRNTPSNYDSRENDYRVGPNYKNLRRFADGGIVGQTDPQQVVMAAVEAIKGNHPQPEMVLGMFLKMFGEEKLRELIRRVKSSEGAVSGPGGPRDDMVPAQTTRGEDVLLSDGEFVLPTDTVQAVGGGDHAQGTAKLYDLIDQARMERMA